VKPNAPVTTMAVPDVVRNAKVEPAKVESTNLADRVWLLGGGSHNSVLVEFNDFVAVVEAPQNEERSLAVMDEVSRLAPNRPIKYVVNTHHHMDHAGGLRTYLAQGTTVVTHAINQQYYVDLLFSTAARTLQPNHMSFFNPMYWISRRPPPIETVGNSADFGGPGAGSSGSVRYVITDHERMMEVLYVEDMIYELGDNTYAQRQSQPGHADGLLAQAKDAHQRRPVFAVGARHTAINDFAWRAHALPEHAQIQTGRHATCWPSWWPRQQRRLHEDRRRQSHNLGGTPLMIGTSAVAGS
jgi:glyoxylase-like metal-dependent hydrolase (beta-lactamase superfamily II)